MQRSSLKFAVFSLVFVFGFALLGAPAAQAAGPAPAVYQDADEDEVEVMGVITAIDEEAGTIEVETEDGTLVVIVVPEDFDFDTVQVGDTIEVTGYETEDGDLAADEITVDDGDDEDDEDVGDDDDLDDEDDEDLDDEDDEDLDDEDDEDLDDEEDDEDLDDEDSSLNFFCVTSGVEHPFASGLAETYDVEYEQIMTWFCDDGFGFGQIMLALQTGKAVEGDAETYLEERSKGFGWGQIWKELELTGRPEHAGPPERIDADGDGKPDHANPNDQDGDGRPDQAGQPGNGNSHNNGNGNGNGNANGHDKDNGNPHNNNGD